MNKILSSDLEQDIRLLIDSGERGCVSTPVTQTLSGSNLSLDAHVIRGMKDGPTLAILACVHGDESGILPMLKEFIALMDPSKLSGTIVVVPIANPLALSAFSRFTPEQHGNIDLHTAFPGNAKGCLTQKIADTITKKILNHADVLVDIHSGGIGGRLQCRVDFDYRLTGEVRDRTISLCKSFGAGLMHENDLTGSASHVVNKRGVPTVNIEISGNYLGPEASSYFDSIGIDGMLRIAHQLQMILEAPELTVLETLMFDRENRIEVNPYFGGFLESKFQSYRDLSEFIAAGTLLGRVIDPYTLECVEELIAPKDGYLFFSRYSGMVEAGAKAFGIAGKENSIWL